MSITAKREDQRDQDRDMRDHSTQRGDSIRQMRASRVKWIRENKDRTLLELEVLPSSSSIAGYCTRSLSRNQAKWGLRQRGGAFHLDRVLSGQHEERGSAPCWNFGVLPKRVSSCHSPIPTAAPSSRRTRLARFFASKNLEARTPREGESAMNGVVVKMVGSKLVVAWTS